MLISFHLDIMYANIRWVLWLQFLPIHIIVQIRNLYQCMSWFTPHLWLCNIVLLHGCTFPIWLLFLYLFILLISVPLMPFVIAKLQPLPVEVKEAQQQRLEELRKQLELHQRSELEKKMALRYRRVKFFGESLIFGFFM